jgi:hypothetical protein
MALSVKHAFQTVLPDDPTKDVSAVEWNQDHTLTGVLGVANGGTGTTTGGGGVLISDTPPVGAPDNALWWESDSGLLYLRFNDGTSTQWVLAAPQPDISVLATATYVDAAVAALQATDAALTTSVNGKVVKAGDTMTGDLIISKANPNLLLNDTTTSGYPDVRWRRQNNDRWVARATNELESGGSTGSNFELIGLTDVGGVSATPIRITRVDGRIVLAADPTASLGAATKQYADLKVAKTGDTMTGSLTPAVNGAVNLGSATLRWGTVFTSDLDLNNGVGDWTIVEGEDELFIHNNKRGKTYKFVMVEVDPSRVPPKKV